MSRVALLLSGGPDSSTLAYWLRDQGHEIFAITFNFGEAEGDAEFRCATDVAQGLGVEHRTVDFVVPMQHLFDTAEPINIMRRVVDRKIPVRPFGAGIAIALGTSVARTVEADELFYAVHADDRHWPDNAPEFFSSLSEAITICEARPFSVRAPFLEKAKVDVVRLGRDLGVPFDKTWSCAANSDVHCGTCDPCLGRKHAFAGASVADPTDYVNSMSVPEDFVP